MLVYKLKEIPDLTLSKYQNFSECGIEGLLNAQDQFIKQLYRVTYMGNISIHYLCCYNSELTMGKRLNIYLYFDSQDGNDDSFCNIRKIMQAASVVDYFKLIEASEEDVHCGTFKYMSLLRKKERFLETIVENEEQFFYVVPNWKMRDEARLYNLFKLMQSFNQECVYRVDLYTENDIEERIHKSFEKPVTYLRNISYKDKGISEYSKMQRSMHDPNADEALHEYETWLKSVDSSAVFRCKIVAMTNDEQYSKILLDSALVESVENGTGYIQTLEGEFETLVDTENLVKKESLASENAPKSLNYLPTSFLTEEVAKFVRFPVLYDGETIEIPKETSAIQHSTGFVLGKERNGYNVTIPEELLTKHMFVCGVPGSGKTNTMLHIANSLWNHKIRNDIGEFQKSKIPFLVLEPAKREYRELALLDIPELLIFSPSSCTNFPIKINPFEFAKGLSVSEHISKLCQVFEGAFPIAPPAPFILDRAIQAIYEKHGWNMKDINMGTKEYPIMSELYEQFEKELMQTNYDSEIQGNIRSVLEMRIGSLLRREMKEIFDVKKSSLAPEDWLKYPVIIELEALGEGPANFVTLLLCTLIREVLKSNPLKDKEKKVRHVIFIEEAHNLIGPEAQVQNGMDSNPKIAATNYIVKMLAEVRALREGIIIADQLPTAMAPEVIKNTNIKLVHRLTSMDDRELVGGTMSASSMQMENMATYTKGKALYTYEDLLRPLELQVNLVEEHSEKTPTDSELFELMSKKEAFREMLKTQENEKWLNLKNKVEKLIEAEETAVGKLKEFNFQNAKFNEFERRVESSVVTLNGIKMMKKALLFECSRVSEEFISKESKKELRDVIENLGEIFEEKLRQFVKYY